MNVVGSLNRISAVLVVLAITAGPIFAFGQPKSRLKLKTSQATSTQSRLSLEASELKQEPKKAQAQWRIGLTGLSFASENRQENTQLAELSLGAKLDLKLLSALDFQARAGLVMATGQAQTRFGEKVPENRLALEEAALNFKPLEVITLSAGALDQTVLDMPLLVSQRPFPGAAESLNFKFNKNTSLDLRAQQVIPTSITMTTKTEGGEKTPTLMTETVRFEAKNLGMMDLATNASLFQFQDLPAHVANESELGGNTVFATSPLTSKFAYEFSGWTAGGAARVNFSRKLSVTLGTQALQNMKAPEGFKNGQITYLESSFFVASGVSLTPRAEMFFNESDSAPAFYNSGEYFHNNRKGFAANLDAKFEKQKFKVGARFVDASLLSSSLTQSPREQLLLLRFETLYADF